MSSFKCPICNYEQSYTYREDAYCYTCNNLQPETEVKTCAPNNQESSTFAQTADPTTVGTATIADPGASPAATVESPVDRPQEQTIEALCRLLETSEKERQSTQKAYELESESRKKWSNRCKKLAALVREATTGHLRANCTCYWCKKLNKILNA